MYKYRKNGTTQIVRPCKGNEHTKSANCQAGTVYVNCKCGGFVIHRRGQ